MLKIKDSENLQCVPVLTPSLEDYLYNIFVILKVNKVARVGEIARYMKVNVSSVVRALKQLSKEGLVNYTPYEFITLTSRGEKLALKFFRKREVIKDFLEQVLFIPKELVCLYACRLEHVVDELLEKRLVVSLECLKNYPEEARKWRQFFSENCSDMQFDVLDREKYGGESMEDKMFLSNLKPGEKGKVIKVHGRGRIRRRIADMGIVTGTMISVERIAPLGDPIEIKVRGYNLSLRKEEASSVEIQKF